jgi:two-component system chemotaxis sensor kinase CheA
VGETEVDLVLRAVDVLSLMINDVGQRSRGSPARPPAPRPSASCSRSSTDRGAARGGGRAVPVCAAPWPTDRREPPAAAAGEDVPFEHDGAARRRRGVATTCRRSAAAATAIKVDTRKLDNIVDVVGELIVVQSLIAQDPALSALVDGRLARNMAQLRRLTPICSATRWRCAWCRSPGFQKVARVVRDLSRKAGKPIDLVITGEDTELDRKMVEEITDPLMHMARNSVDHGIEPPDVREANGKPARATVSLSAYYQGSHVIIEVKDDGAGSTPSAFSRAPAARG